MTLRVSSLKMAQITTEGSILLRYRSQRRKNATMTILISQKVKESIGEKHQIGILTVSQSLYILIVSRSHIVIMRSQSVNALTAVQNQLATSQNVIARIAVQNQLATSQNPNAHQRHVVRNKNVSYRK
jgi:hypothetical protein